MFDFLFGWRKASKCKNLIGRVQCRLKLLKNKRISIIRQLREDVAQLLNNGQEQSAFARVDQLFKDQNAMDAYDLLDHFCEFIIINLRYIRRHKDCPNDINEAVSSLIFAAARCGDLPELQRIRKLLGKRYGDRFATVAVELLPGNLVNPQVSEKLCIKSVPYEVKLKMMHEIARDHRFILRTSGIEDQSELQHQQVHGYNNCHLEDQVSQGDIHINDNSVLGSQKQASNVKEAQVKGRSDSSSKNWQKIVTESCQSHTSSDPLIHKNTAKLGNYDKLDLSYEPEMVTYMYSDQSSQCSSILSTASVQHNVEVITTTTSESSPQFLEKNVVYLDDIEEFQSTLVEYGNCKDQRLFMFKSAILPMGESFRDGRANSSISNYDDWDKNHTKHYDSRDRKECARSSSKRRKSSGKRLKRRSVSGENQIYQSCMSTALSMKDVESTRYYGKSYNDCSPVESYRSHHRRKHHKKMPIEEIRSSPPKPYPLRKTRKKLCCEEMGESCLANSCRYNQRIAHSNCRGIEASVSFISHYLEQEERQDESFHLHCSPDEESLDGTFWVTRNKAVRVDQEDREMNWESLPQKPGKRNYEYGSNLYNAMASQCHNVNKQRKKTEGDAEEILDCPASYVSSRASCSRVASPWRYTEACPPYSRAMTMPPERPNNPSTDSIFRSTSCQFQPPVLSSHVHPRLPDYDDIAAKFMALKKAHLQSKHNLS